MRSAALSFVRTYLIALAVLMTIGIGAFVIFRQAVSRSGGFDAPRPTGAVLRTYDLEIKHGAEKPRIVAIDVDGAACQALGTSSFLATACVLALNIDPTYIAAEAFGRLNTEDTPSSEAMIWRAILNDDPNICDRGGLTGDRLTRCRIAADRPFYTTSRDGWTVTVKQAAGT